MGVEVEERLRQAYAQLPADAGDGGERVDVLARSRHTAARLRRRRAAGMCAGTVAAAVAVTAVAVLAPGMSTSDDHDTLVPAAVTAAPTRTASHPPAAPTTPSKPPQAKEDTTKPLAGLSGRLLPHGAQLAAGVVYHGATTVDYRETWATSRADGYANAVPVPVLVGAAQTADAPSPAETRAAYGILSGVEDTASTSGPESGPQSQFVDSAIVRFRTPALAKAALGKVRRTEGGLYWTAKSLTAPNVPWSGVPGVTGDHGVYDYPAGTPQKLFVAYQVVGSYIVSANSAAPAAAEKAVTDTVSNLKTAGLVQ